MKAANYDFVFEKNTDWSFSIGYNTGSINNYTPVNVSGYKAEFRLYLNRYSAPVLVYTSTEGKIVIIPGSGKFEFYIPAEVNSTYNVKEMFYTFTITDTQNKTEKLLKGAVKVEL
jgi:hypothetical protein